MATRRFGGAVFDHGAQFLTARSPRFRDTVEDWVRAGVVREWYRSGGSGADGAGDGHPHWCGVPAMSAVPKHLATGLDIHLATEVAALAPEEKRAAAGRRR